MGLVTAWSAHLRDPVAKKQFEETVLNSKTVINRLLQLIAEEEQQLDRADFSISDFNVPNWAEKQAFRNGDRSRLRKFKTLLTLTGGTDG